MVIIKDKEIQLCVCGREKKTTVRLAKRRVSAWLGIMATAGFVIVLATYPSMLLDSIDIATLVWFSLVAYYIVGTLYRSVAYIQKKHTFYCALRRAFWETV